MLKLATKMKPETNGLETAWRAGFRYVEFWLDEALLLDWQRVAQIASEYPFDYVPHFPNRAELSEEALAGAVSLYQALECEAMVIHQPQFERFSDTLLHLDSDLVLAVENHRLSPAAFSEWAAANRFLTLDVEHLWKFTLEDRPVEELETFLRRFLESHAEQLRHVHLPGYAPGLVPGYDEHRPMHCSRDMVFRVFNLLEEHAHRGFVVAEVISDYQNPIDLRMDRLLFNRWRETSK